MDFDEIFKQGHKNQRHGYDQHYGHDEHSHSSHSHNKHNNMKQELFNKVRSNPKFKSMLIIAAIIIIVVVILAVVLLFPLIMQLINYIGENGLKGIIDQIWNGAKK